jgi:hypothetical protein
MKLTTYKWLKMPDVSEFKETDKIFLDKLVYVNYMDTIFRKQNICSLQTTEINEYFLSINISSLTFKLSNKFRNYMSKCKNDPKIQFIIIPIALNFPNNFDNELDKLDNNINGHSNVIIIDTINNIIEYFEPHGEIYKGSVIFYDVQLIIETIIHQILPIEYHINRTNSKYIFENVFKSCPNFNVSGIQTTDSYCLAWSLLYTELRLINSKYTSQDIINILNEIPNADLLYYIKKYITFIQFKSKPRKNIIYDSANEFTIANYILVDNKPILKPILLQDIIDQNSLKQRIDFLLNEYKEINNEINTSQYLNLDNDYIIKLNKKLRLLFNELISYQSFPGFYNYLLKFFSFKTL